MHFHSDKSDETNARYQARFANGQALLQKWVYKTLTNSADIRRANEKLHENPRLYTLLRALECAVPNVGLWTLCRDYQRPEDTSQLPKDCLPFEYAADPPAQTCLWDQVRDDNTFGKKSLLVWLRDYVYLGDLYNYEAAKGCYSRGFHMLASIILNAVKHALPVPLVVPLVGRAYLLLRRSYTREASLSGNQASMTALQSKLRHAAQIAYGSTSEACIVIRALTTATMETAKSRALRGAYVKEEKQKSQHCIPKQVLDDARSTLYELGEDQAHPWERFVFIIMATGSRPIEVAMTGTYTQLTKNYFSVKGLAKKRRGETGSRNAPLLVSDPVSGPLNTSNLADYIAETRRQLGLTFKADADGEMRKQVTKMLHQNWAKVIKEHFPGYDVDAPALRALYANRAYDDAIEQCPHMGVSRNAFIAKVLGHTNLDSAPAYQGWHILPIKRPKT